MYWNCLKVGYDYNSVDEIAKEKLELLQH